MKKIMFLMILMFIISMFSGNALIDSCRLNNPGQNTTVQYDNGLIKLNATGNWSGSGNMTNVTFVLTNGVTSRNYSNSTINGSKTVSGGGLSVGNGDFTFTITSSDVLENGNYTVFAMCHNDTDITKSDSTLNSTKIMYTIDSINPSIALQRPQDRTSTGLSNGYLIFEYIPTETNLGNCTLYLGGNPQQSTTSATTSPNITSGAVTKFTKGFGGNNASLAWLVECTDLAGRKTNSSTRTVSVSVTGFSNVIDSSGGISSSAGNEYYVENGKTLAVGNTNSQMPAKGNNKFLQQYGVWIAFGFVALVIYLIWKWKPK